MENQQNQLITLNVGKPTLRSHKLTSTRRKQFLEVFSKTANITKACDAIKVSRKAIYDLIERDPDFKASFEEIDNRITDALEEVSINVAIQPTRESFNDRKLQLQARRPDKYNPKTEIDIKHQITLKNADQVASQILSEYSLQSAISADYEIIEDS